ncbi:YfhO family protein [candidate division CSSED10-310 bacterium]|uniref:YfhO family protein n=1 Tax=candidate division CSSED10-310 bacterium TaxID=2855610 RepID=A0ABV6YY66_UNCC1
MVQRKEWLIIIVLFICFLTFFFWQNILSGIPFIPTDIIYQFSPWQGMMPLSLKPQNPIVSLDFMLQLYPWYQFAREKIRQGIIPLWNPYTGSGSPFLANLQSSIFYPTVLVHYLLPLNEGYFLGLLLNLLIGGLSFYYLMRLHGASSFAAFAGAMIFTFNGFTIKWLTVKHTTTFVLLPLILVWIESYCRSGKKSNLVLLSVTVGVMFLGGILETPTFILFVSLLYMIIRLVQNHDVRQDLSQIVQKFSVLVLFIVLGGFLAQAQLLPFMKNMVGSAAYNKRQAISAENDFTTLPFSALINFVVPKFYGHMPEGNQWYNRVNVNNRVNHGYCGIISLMLALLGLISGRKSALYLVSVLFLILSVGFIFKFPLIYHILRHLPGFGLSRAFRFLSIYLLAISILAVIGLDQFRKVMKFRTLNMVSVFFLISLLSLSTGFYLYYSALIIKLNTYIHFMTQVKVLVFFTVTGIIILHLMKRKQKIGIYISFLIFLNFCDVFLFLGDWNPSRPAHLIYPRTEALSFLERDQDIFRVLPLGFTLPPNSSLIYSLSDIRSYDPLISVRYRRYLSLIDQKANEHLYIMWNYDSKLIDLLNVKYILLPPNQHLDKWDRHNKTRHAAEKFKLAYRGDLTIYQNKGCLPRAFMVHEIQVFDDAARAIAQLQDPEFDPRKAVIIEDSGIQNRTFPDGEATVKVIELQDHKIKVQVSSLSDGCLVLAQNYSPGWKVFVDGQEQDLHQVNFILCGVLMKAGQHVVEFKYQPSSFLLGLFATLLSLLLLTTFSLAGCRQRL